MSSSDYRAELFRAMSWLGTQPDTLFLGQAVKFPGTAMRETLLDVPEEKLIELPVMEDAQLGMCTGLALGGFVPISIYPRWNFLLLAASQLVLHLDKLPIYSQGGYHPKVIIRTAVASDAPLNPQAQHLGDYSAAFRKMLSMVCVVDLHFTDQVFPAYKAAYESRYSTIIVEHSRCYV